MKHTRYLAAALLALGLAACGGNPTASDADVSPRFNNGGGWGGSGHREEGTGGVMNTGTNTPPPPPPGDTTSLVGGGFIGSGT